MLKHKFKFNQSGLRIFTLEDNNLLILLLVEVMSHSTTACICSYNRMESFILILRWKSFMLFQLQR